MNKFTMVRRVSWVWTAPLPPQCGAAPTLPVSRSRRRHRRSERVLTWKATARAVSPPVRRERAPASRRSIPGALPAGTWSAWSSYAMASDPPCKSSPTSDSYRQFCKKLIAFSKRPPALFAKWANRGAGPTAPQLRVQRRSAHLASWASRLRGRRARAFSEKAPRPFRKVPGVFRKVARPICEKAGRRFFN